ncbi:unnamed protein product [Owenia fusiformis]|uniref:VWFA domain-containing protein n=1 Tax=Owenia fusiformis TaxID=6347 RepID=A0A8S4Q199_OWEFU|nr:unnamed protein product [Owenia fusiformis]
MNQNMVFVWLNFAFLAPLIVKGQKSGIECVDIVFVLQTSCDLDPALVQGVQTSFIGKVAKQMSTNKNSTMTLITYDDIAQVQISALSPGAFLEQLGDGFKGGDNCPRATKAITAGALTLVDFKNYFSEDRGKIVVVLSDGISFDKKSNMDITLERTKTAIRNLQNKGINFATFEFYEEDPDDDRIGNLEYEEYNPIIKMNTGDDFTQTFIDSVTENTRSLDCGHKIPEIVCREPILDIIYVIDRSNSIDSSDIARVKTFLQDLTAQILKTSKETWIAAISYNSDVYVEVPLTGEGAIRDASGIIKKLGEIITETALGTYTDKAINYAYSKHAFRSEANRWVILITDGVTKHAPYTNGKKSFSHLTVHEAKWLRERDIDLLILGLPNMKAKKILDNPESSETEINRAMNKVKAGRKEWEDMIWARYPENFEEKKKTNLFTLESMDEMRTKFNDILTSVCV